MLPDHGLDEALALVRHLNYERAGDVDDTIPADWGPFVRQLLDTRATYGPIPATDPIALLASSTRAAQTTAPPTGAAAGYQIVANAAARHTSTAASDQDLRNLYRMSFEAVHGLRTRTQDPAAARWLYAAERSLDASLARPVEPSLTATALAAWQHTLAQLPPGDATRWAAVATQRTILREAATVVAIAGTLDSDLAASLHEQLLAVIGAFNPSPNPRVPVPPLTREARLVGQVGADLVRSRSEPPAVRMSALLASHFGQVGIASRVLDVPQATHAADRLESLTLDWIIGRIQTHPAPSREVDAPPSVKGSSRTRPEQTQRPEPPAPTPIEGDLSYAMCAELAKDRDLGRLAAAAIAGDAAAVNQIGTDRDLQALVDAGRDATAQLAMAALPMAEQFVRKALPSNQDDMRADQHVRLLVAAQAYDPEQGSWYSFARSWLGHDSGYYDSAGIAGTRSGRHVFAAEAALYADLQRDATLNEVAAAAGVAPGYVDNLRLLRSATHLDAGLESGAPTVASAEDTYLARHERRTLYDAIDALPSDPAKVIRARLDGLTIDQIAEQLHSSPSSVRRRLNEGMEQLRVGLLGSPADATTANLASAAASLAQRPPGPAASQRPSAPETKAPGLA